MQGAEKRLSVLKAVIFVVAAAILCRLFYLQAVMGEQYLAMSTRKFTTSVVDKAPRGEIFDRNGKTLVSNRIGYSLQVQKTDMSNDDFNKMLIKILDILAESGVGFEDTFPITGYGEEFAFVDENGDSSTDDEKEAWFEKRKKNLKSDMTAYEVVEYYSKNVYGISDDMSDADKRRIIGVRYEADLVGGFSLTTPFVIASDIDMNVVTKIKERQREFDGVIVTNDYIRNYNQGTLAAHILGRVGKIYAEEYEELKDKGYSYNDLIGKQGVELIAEEYLHGIDGTRNLEQNVNGNIVKLADDVPAKAGDYVVLTIDSELQRAAENSLAENINKIRANGGSLSQKKGADCNAGAAVVLDIKNGDILAMASYPTFDLANFNRDYEQLSQNKDKPMWNRALSGTYTPGSTFKPFIAIAALENGVIDTDTIIECKGIYDFYESYQPRCWIWTEQHRVHGKLNVTGGIENSCNCFFYEVGRRLGIDKIDAYAKKFGFGEFTGVEFKEEAKGYVASPQMKKKLFKDEESQKWYAGDTIQTAIGQSNSNFTPIQLANYIATVANGGTRYKTNIIKTVRSSDDGSIVMESKPEVAERISLKPSTVEAVKNGMKKVVEDGSAKSIFEGYPIEIGGKTGTAQVGTKVTNNALFVAFAPFDNPEIAVAVVIEHGLRGANAAYVARDIFDEYFNLNTVYTSDQVGMFEMIP